MFTCQMTATSSTYPIVMSFVWKVPSVSC